MNQAPRPLSSCQAVLAQAEQAFLAGRLAEAEALCRQVPPQSPGHGAALRQLGLVRLVGGDAAGALALVAPLSDAAPDDVALGIARAEAEWAVNAAPAAIPHYRRVLARAPGRWSVRARLGLALLVSGDPASARPELEEVAAARPDEAGVLTHLGMALSALGAWADAVAVLRRAVERDGADPGCAFHLGQALRADGRIADAVAALREAVRRGPEQAHLRLALGDALFAQGAYGAAAAELRRAVAQGPDVAVAWAKLGDAERLCGAPGVATACYRRAAALLPSAPELHALLGNALLAAGDVPGGTAALARANHAAWSRPGRDHVAVLAAPGAANTPTDYIIDRSRFNVDAVFLLDGCDIPLARLADRYGVLFNAVSDPDADPAALHRAGRLASRLGLPVINAPDVIAGTTRERMAARLAGIDGLRVPSTRRYRRDALPGSLDGPVLVRPTGSHGGGGVALAQGRADLEAIAAGLTGDEVYLTGFVDLRGRDRRYRKLRLVFVDGAIFPVHLAIGEHWLGHYFRARMAAEPCLRAEEAAFLQDAPAYLGGRAWAALQAVQARVRLDFFGLDGALDRDGALVLFECNAAMLVRHADRPAMFDYKRAAAERIRAACGDMIDRVRRRTAA